MMRTSRWAHAILFVAAVAGRLMAQQPAQFKADVRMTSADGSTATGVMYFGGAKMRTEIAMDAQNIILLADPAAKTQVVLMPDNKIYMQMPIGQGPISIPISGPADPTNPCSGGSGATDCVKGEGESINGHETVRWDYTSKEGTRTRAWVSTKLRFPVKTEADDGSGMEFRNIAVGPQAANLFTIPAGYTKMDMGAIGGMAGMPGRGAANGRGRGRGNSSDPVAAAMANMPPEAAAAMAAAMRGDSPKGPVAPTGSIWEKGKGWIITATLTATATTNRKTANETETTVYSIKYSGTTPLNYGAPAAGVPGAPGPVWSLLAGSPDIGTREANAVPLSLTVTTESTSDRSWKGDCRGGEAGSDPGTSHATMKTSFQKSVPIIKPSVELIGGGNLTISADLKTYDLNLGFPNVTLKEVTQVHTETTGCTDKKVGKEDKTQEGQIDTGASYQLKGQPLPATVSVITGTKKVPLKLGMRDLDATLTWTLTPIR